MVSIGVMVSLHCGLLFKLSRVLVRRRSCLPVLVRCYPRITEGKTALNVGDTKSLTWCPDVVTEGAKLQYFLAWLLGST